jgi:hypothetical protein
MAMEVQAGLMALITGRKWINAGFGTQILTAMNIAAADSTSPRPES